MISIGRRTAALLPVSFLCACVAIPPISGGAPRDNQAVLGPGLACTIPPPAAAGGAVNAAQSIVAHFRDQTYAFQVQLQITPGEFNLVALDNLGRRAMTVKWNGVHLDFTRAPWLPDLLRPADILTDVAIVYWPEDSVASALSACGARLTDTDGMLTLSAHERDLMTVRYEQGRGWSRTAHLRNLAFGFGIDVQSVELAQ
jgi:hypothetical protein